MKIENDGKKTLTIINNSIALKLKFKNFFEKEYWRNELEKRKKIMNYYMVKINITHM